MCPAARILGVEALPLRTLALGGERLAYRTWAPSTGQPAHAAVLVCNGLRSAMTGRKVQSVLQLCQRHRLEFVAYDHRGFGASSGAPLACGPEVWRQDAYAVLQHVVRAPCVLLLGSSIGGWVALRLLEARGAQQAAAAGLGAGGGVVGGVSAAPSPESRIAGLVLVAPAVDLTEARWGQLGREQQQGLLCSSAATVRLGSPYLQGGGGAGDEVAAPFFVQGRRNLLFAAHARKRELVLREAFDAAGTGVQVEGEHEPGGQANMEGCATLPQALVEAAARLCGARGAPAVRILHGTADEVVRLERSRLLASLLGPAAVLEEVAEGDHRLSDEGSLQLIGGTLCELLRAADEYR